MRHTYLLSVSLVRVRAITPVARVDRSPAGEPAFARSLDVPDLRVRDAATRAVGSAERTTTEQR